MSIATMDSPKHWYVLRAWNELNTASVIRAMGFEAYVPCETVERRLGRKLQRITRPVCLGYVFVGCAADDVSTLMGLDDAHDFVRATSPSGERVPATMPAEALQWLFLAELFGDLDYTRKPKPYAPERGHSVRVGSGKWKDYIGRILSVGKRKSVVDLIKGFGRLEIDTERLIKLDDAA